MSDEHSTATSSIEFMRQFRELIDGLLRDLPSANGSGPLLLDVLEEHLRVVPDRLAVVTEPVPEHRLVDADIALEEVADRDSTHRLVGLGGGDMRHHMSFSDLLQQARASQQIPLAQVDYLQAATGPGSGEQRNVVALGMRLFTYEGHPVAVRQTAARPHFGRPEGGLDVLAADRAVAEALLVEVRALMDERSVFRGKVVTFSGDPYGRGIAA